jgi:hypothetical protein
MARVNLGQKGMSNAIKDAPADVSVRMLAERYDKLVQDLEYVLSHLSEENFLPGALARIRGEES